MRQVTTSTEIRRPVEEVFAFLTDLANAPRWTVGLVEVRHDGPLRAGARGVDVRTIGRRQVEMPWEVTSYDPPKTVTFVYGDPFPATATFSFERTAEGTRLTCDTTMRLKGLYRLLAPIVVREARTTDEQQFANVREILEAGGAPAPSGQDLPGGQPGA